MEHTNRKRIQDFFIRICRDSGFTLEATNAAKIAAIGLGCHPLEIWLAMPSYDDMVRIAAGKHPAAKRK